MSFIQRRFFSNGRPIQSTVALATREFKLCGEIMGMSILQGGPAPNFMSSNIAAYLTGNNLDTQDNQCQRYKTLGESVSTYVFLQIHIAYSVKLTSAVKGPQRYLCS